MGCSCVVWFESPHLDIGDHDKITEIIEKINDKYENIDILVKNAGMWLRGSLDIPIEDFHRVIAINLLAPYLFINEIFPFMQHQKAGYIINIASRVGKVGYIDTGI